MGVTILAVLIVWQLVTWLTQGMYPTLQVARTETQFRVIPSVYWTLGGNRFFTTSANASWNFGLAMGPMLGLFVSQGELTDE